jgi:hypothetical protein
MLERRGRNERIGEMEGPAAGLGACPQLSCASRHGQVDRNRGFFKRRQEAIDGGSEIGATATRDQAADAEVQLVKREH